MIIREEWNGKIRREEKETSFKKGQSVMQSGSQLCQAYYNLQLIYNFCGRGPTQVTLLIEICHLCI